MATPSSTHDASEGIQLPADPPLFEDCRTRQNNEGASGHGQNGHAATTSSASTPDTSGSNRTMNGRQGTAFKAEWPLTSWANTPQNAVCIAFLMGAIFALGLVNVDRLFSKPEYLLSTPRGTWSRFLAALRTPKLGAYVAALVVFHLAEYLTTAIWNPSKVEVKSFLLEDKNHNAAHTFAFAEYLLEETFLPEKWLAYKHDPRLALAGLILTLAAQYLRSLAMATAAANFSHLIVYTKAPSHSLVRTGIYAWSRHPSYVAFFYWALGTQIFIANPVSFFAFSIILYRFFSHRIKVEEWYLVKFFGDDYTKYQQEVPARIPFIR